MAVNKKDRKQIVSSWPQRSVAELARDYNVKPVEIEEVLDSAGVRTQPQRALLGRTRPRLVAILLLVIAIALVYGNSVRNGFHYDDIHSLLQNLGVQVEWNRNPASRSLFYRYFYQPELFSSRPQVAMPRPLLMVTFGLNYLISRYDAWSWVLFNILLHMANTVIIYIALCHLIGRQRFALLTALIWAVHPINTETVNYINCRSESLSIFFMLLTMYFFTRSLLEKQRWGLRVAALGMFALGLLTKELVITSAGMVLVLDLLLVWPQEKSNEPWTRRALQRAVGWYLPVVGLVVAYMLYRMAVLDTAVVKAAVRPFGDNLLVQMRALFSYISLLFFPFKLNISYENAIMLVTVRQFTSNLFVTTGDPPFPIIVAMLILYALLQYGVYVVARGVWKDGLPPIWQPAALFVVGLVALVLSGLIIDNTVINWIMPVMFGLSAVLVFVCYLLFAIAGPVRQRPAWQPLVGFAILNFFVTLSITTLVPLNALMNEHRLYLPSLGAAMLLAGLLESAAANRNRRAGNVGGWWPLPVQALTIVIILLFACQTMAHNFTWYTDYTVWKDSVTKSPHKAQVVSDLGNAYYRTARNLVERGEISADGRIDKADRLEINEIFRYDLPVGPITPEVKKTLQMLFMRGLNRAELLYMWSIRVEPDYFKAWHNLGTVNYTYAQVALQKGEIAKARQYLERAVFFFDGATRISANGESFNDWASSVMQLADPSLTPDPQKQMEYYRQAEDLYTKAVQYNPEMCKGFSNLGMIKAKLQKPQEALQYLDMSIQCNPLDPQPYYLKGVTYRNNNLGQAESIQAFQKCLEVSPGFAECQRMLIKAREGTPGVPDVPTP